MLKKITFKYKILFTVFKYFNGEYNLPKINSLQRFFLAGDLKQKIDHYFKKYIYKSYLLTGNSEVSMTFNINIKK